MTRSAKHEPVIGPKHVVTLHCFYSSTMGTLDLFIKIRIHYTYLLPVFGYKYNAVLLTLGCRQALKPFPHRPESGRNVSRLVVVPA